MIRLKLLGTSVLMAAFGLAAHGQKTLNAAGGSKTLGNTVHGWSVGEMVLVRTASSNTLTVTQGVLQPLATKTDAIAPNLRISGLEVFPNPATEHLFLKHHFSQPGILMCRVLDATGKTVQRESFELASGTGTQELNLREIAAGTYLLQVRFTDRSQAEQDAVYTIQKNL